MLWAATPFEHNISCRPHHTYTAHAACTQHIQRTCTTSYITQKSNKHTLYMQHKCSTHATCNIKCIVFYNIQSERIRRCGMVGHGPAWRYTWQHTAHTCWQRTRGECPIEYGSVPEDCESGTHTTSPCMCDPSRPYLGVHSPACMSDVAWMLHGYCEYDAAYTSESPVECGVLDDGDRPHQHCRSSFQQVRFHFPWS